MSEAFEQFIASGGGWWCSACQLSVNVVISETDSTSATTGEVNCTKCGLSLHTYHTLKDLERVGLLGTPNP